MKEEIATSPSREASRHNDARWPRCSRDQSSEALSLYR